MIKLIFLVAFCSLLNACSSANQAQIMDGSGKNSDVYQNFIIKQELISVDKVEPFNFARFMALDDQHIVVSSWNKKHYLLVTNNNCDNLQFAQKVDLIRLDDNSIDISTDRIARVGDDYQSCTIDHIYKLYDVQFEALSNLRRERYNFFGPHFSNNSNNYSNTYGM